LEPQGLDEHLKPLARLIGHWKGAVTGGAGKTGDGEVTVEADPGGTFITERVRQSLEGRITTEFGVYFWQPERRSIAHAVFDGVGGRRMGRLLTDQGRWVEQVESYDRRGTPGTRVDTWEWPTEGSFARHSAGNFDGSQPRPDGPEWAWERK
jgi:hypothetical protein